MSDLHISDAQAVALRDHLTAWATREPDFVRCEASGFIVLTLPTGTVPIWPEMMTGFTTRALMDALKHAETRHNWPGLLDTLTVGDDRHPILQRLAYLNLLIDWERDVEAEAERLEARS